MVKMKNFTQAVNQRCMQAMALEGYAVPRAVSMNLKDPRRPSFETLIESQTVAECGGECTRTFECTLIFFPENRDAPADELKRMDDAVTTAFCQPLEVDGQELSFDESGIRNTIEAGCLVSSLRYESTFDAYDDLDELPDMEILVDEIETLNESEG